MEKKPLGFIYTNFDRHLLKKVSEAAFNDGNNLLQEVSKGIPKEYLTVFPKSDCFLNNIALRTPILEEFMN